MMQQHIHNQSRSRKPLLAAHLDFASGDLMNSSQTPKSPLTVTQQQQQPQSMLSKKNLIMQQQQFQDSFDDLDSVEVINMSQCNVTKSKHNQSSNFAPSSQQPLSVISGNKQLNLKSNLKSSMKAGNQFAASSMNDMAANDENQQQLNYQINQQQPVSILKRFDSSEKMYPISRPGSGASSNKHSVAAAAAAVNNMSSHLCSASLNNFGHVPNPANQMGTLFF
jgi:hypothetical protein